MNEKTVVPEKIPPENGGESIAQLQAQNRELVRELDLYRMVIDNLPDLIYAKDAEGRFVLNNMAHARDLGANSPAEMKGKSNFDFFPPEMAARFYADEKKIVETGQPVLNQELYSIKPGDKSGKKYWAASTKLPWRDAHGNVLGMVGITRDINEQKVAEEAVEQIHRQLLDTSRQAGMAEVATSVLHNVGNVLNSVNVSATLLLDNAKKSSVNNLARALALMVEHLGDLANYLTTDAKGKQLPGYLVQVSEQLSKEQQRAVAELESLRQNIEHINEIVAMQQNYAKVSGVPEAVKVTDLVEDALRMNAGALARHDITLLKDFEAAPVITAEKHKVLQILVNLIRNAKYACDDSGRSDKQIKVRVSECDRRVRIEVTDNGVGIPPENLTRIFNHGFTTRKEGHGFGLHNGALTAKELGGTLIARSDGPGRGATFILDMPLARPV